MAESFKNSFKFLKNNENSILLETKEIERGKIKKSGSNNFELKTEISTLPIAMRFRNHKCSKLPL